ncbi:MAG: PAS domain S-box protein [Theionarchaea archaeon]|nr:PAS domain S-box protein [Theionarchaea archaeon]
MTSVRTGLRTLGPGDHVLLVREDTKSVISFLVDNIKPKVLLYIGEEKYENRRKGKVKGAVIRFFSPEKFISGENPDYEPLISRVIHEIDDVRKKGGSQIWLLCDMRHVSEKIASLEGLSRYETRLEGVCSDKKIICICVYSKKDNPSLLLSAFTSHPFVCVEDRLCKNIYFLTENQSSTPSMAVDIYLRNLLSIDETGEKLQEIQGKISAQQKKSNKKYRDLVDHVPDAIYSLNNRGEFIEVNTGSTIMLGYSREEFLEKHFSALIHPDDLRKAAESFEELVRGKREKTMGLELRLLTNTGSIRIGELNARAIYDEKGQFVKTEGIVRDITDRKKQEKDLEFLARVVETVSDAVVITDTDGIITYVNPTAYAMFGCSKKELEGKSASILFSNSSHNALLEILTRIHTGEWEGEISAIKKGGNRFPAWVRASVLHDESKNTLNAVMVFRDITLQKEAEEKLERYALLLEMKVKEKTRGTETLLKTSYALRNTSNWKRGTDTIMKGIVEGLGFDGAAIFFLNDSEKALECLCHLNFPDHLCEKSLSLSQDRHMAIRCVTEKTPLVLHDTVNESLDYSLEEPGDLAWVPILFQAEVLGVLAAYKKSTHDGIEPEDVDMLQLYANLIAEFIERTRVVVKPMAENQVSTPSKYNLELQETYLLEEEKPRKAFDIFADLVKHGFRGFGICRTHPQKVRELFNLEKTPMMWLSEIDTSQVEQVGPKDIPKLIYLVSEFIKRAQPAAVLIEGVEYLVIQNDFNTILRLLHTLADHVATSHSVLLLPINPKALPSHQYFMLRTAFTLIDEG